MRTKHFWISTIVVSVAAVMYIGCNSQAEEAKQVYKIPVKTASVIHKKMAFPVQTSGMLASQSEMKLSFKTGGIISRLHVDEGASVRKGQLLASLDLSEIQAQVSQAQSGYDKAQRDLGRAKNLFADSVATLEQMQNATTALDVAQANLKIAMFNLRHSKIYAPADGKILKRFVQQNELVSAGFPVFEFGTSSQGWLIRTGVSERDVVQLQLGDSAVVHFDSYPNRNFTAVVSEIAQALDPASATFEVELLLSQADVRLVSGFVADVQIFPSTRQTFAVIPIDAMVEGNGTEGFVFALSENGDVAKKVAVKIAKITDDAIAITRGLENVQRVITDGAAYLTDGAAVHSVIPN